MKVISLKIFNTEKSQLDLLDFKPDLLLMFVSPNFEQLNPFIESVNQQYPECIIIGCSTSGEINDTSVNDNSISLTAIKFEKTKLKLVEQDIICMDCSFESGKQIVEQLKADDLKHILVLSDGLNVNGAELVDGMKTKVENVTITGGLAGDGADFSSTFVITNKGASDKKIIGLGFYGDSLKIGFGSHGGWDSFGVERLVTKSVKNVLYELDGKPALELYKSFLGPEASKELPSSGLLFPLSLRTNDDKPVVRTILAINEEDQSLTFAGNIPEGSYVRLMKANVDRLITGAQNSASISNEVLRDDAELSILISCVGRRLVLKQLVEEELESVREVLGQQCQMTGFYSYGEIAPFGEFSPCQLHNQTMTITTFTEC